MQFNYILRHPEFISGSFSTKDAEIYGKAFLNAIKNNIKYEKFSKT